MTRKVKSHSTKLDDVIIETDKGMIDNQNAIIKNSPLKIFVG